MTSVFSPGASKTPKKKKGPGVLSRVMDVLSRPQYASAEVVRRATGKGKGSVLGGLTGGLSGKNKTSYSTVLKEHGIKGPVGTIAGFAGDVLLDPTTYVSLGSSAAGKTAARGAAKIAEKTGAEAIAKKAAVKVGESAAGKSASNLGKEVSKRFRTGHGLPDDVHQVKLKHAGKGGKAYTDELQEIRDVFRGTTKKQRIEINRSLQDGDYYDLPEPDRELALYAKKAMGMERRKKIPTKVIWGSKNQDITSVIARSKYKANQKATHDAFMEEVKDKFPEALKDPEVQKHITVVRKTFSNDPDVTNYFIRKFDKVQNIWKTQATVLNPGHHVRNLMGDTYMNFLDGVNVRAYHDAAKIVSDHVKDYTIKVPKHGRLHKAQLKSLYEGQGLKSGYVQSENLLKSSTRFKNASRTLEAIGRGTDKREDFTRYAHFIDALKKESKKGGTLEQAAERAAKRVRKFNFDYSDLTDFEKKYMKRIVPFYTFTRKALPTQLEMLWARPGKVVAVSKGQKAIERLTGARTSDEDPYPGLDHAIPPWYEDKLTVGVGNNKIVSPSLPVDLIGEFSQGGPPGVIREIAGRTSPFIRGPLEVATGRDMQYGFKQKMPDYLLKQLTASRLASQQITGNKKDEKELKLPRGGPNIDERQINWLTGLGIHRIGEPPSRKKKKKSSGGTGTSGSVFSG
jgi:hypothetical protein